ncbi:hypothetical protein HC031_30960 [Planosporangium thailandense]|uniref:Uncharacterized protein n=1 Tax=Planosporangium thailandense TaxID=765197 RepID=A0ABX0Y6R9_9ACTN|nr:hypothetical protein [Planosporangium thailandense]NJC74100.1 hypothetical protein [Planosporangium thailandense]
MVTTSAESTVDVAAPGPVALAAALPIALSDGSAVDRVNLDAAAPCLKSAANAVDALLS